MTEKCARDMVSWTPLKSQGFLGALGREGPNLSALEECLICLHLPLTPTPRPCKNVHGVP